MIVITGMSKKTAEKRWFVENRWLPDKYTVLEGDGKLRRHIKLLTQEEIES